MDLKPQRRIVDQAALRKFRELRQRCLFCSQASAVDAHHVLPKARGGDDLFENLVPLCRRCHSAVHGSPYTRGTQNGRQRVTGPIVRRRIGQWLRSDDGLEARSYLAGKLGTDRAKNYALREFGVRL